MKKILSLLALGVSAACFPLLAAADTCAFGTGACATSSFTVSIPDNSIPLYNGTGSLAPSNLIDFGKVSSPIPSNTNQDFPLTIGTFSSMDNLSIAVSNTGGVNPNDPTQFYMTIPGTSTHLAYQMEYTSCAGAPLFFTHGAAVTLNNSGALMADTTPNAAPCHPYPQGGGTPGNGAGKLRFTLFPGAVAAGAYQDTVTLTITAG